jgi:P27 family predicted phage terminase small subunit
MGKRGPSRLPTSLKLTRGTYQQSKQGPPEQEPAPQELTKLPPAPRRLGRLGKKQWRDAGTRMLKMGMLTNHDLDTLESYAHLFDERERLEKLLDKEGRYQKTGTGAIVHHPAVRELRDTNDRLFRYFQEFGMSPSSRGSIRIEKKTSTGLKVRARA